MKRLSTQQVKDAIHFRQPPRPPVLGALVCEPALERKHAAKLVALRAEFPDDPAYLNIHVDYWQEDEPGNPRSRWAFGDKQLLPNMPIDANPIIEDWSELDSFLAEMPTADDPRVLEPVRALRASDPDHYLLIGFGHYFHQKLTAFRGTENMMFDYFDHPQELKRLLDAVLDYYLKLIDHCAEIGVNGVVGSEDLGFQRGLFMAPEQFREFFKGLYEKMAGRLHAHGMEFWMHSCGNIAEILPDLIDAGVDVLHPLQAGTMDDARIAREFQDRITFNVGMDVQSLIPFGSVDEVIAGVKQRFQTFYHPRGGCIYSAGNVIMDCTPIENIEAYIRTLYGEMQP